MTVQGYLQENGKGAFQAYRVPDLTPALSAPIELLVVLESPHLDEIEHEVPISGKAGRDALRFLMKPSGTTGALGPFVAALHAKGDGRLAILNVSEMPLQHGAFARSKSLPTLNPDDWGLLDKLRTRRAKHIDSIRDPALKGASALLLSGLQRRVDTLHIAVGATVITAGTFAQRYWRSLARARAASVLPVPHPSFDQWDRVSNSTNPRLIELRRLFTLHTA